MLFITVALFVIFAIGGILLDQYLNQRRMKKRVGSKSLRVENKPLKEVL